MRCLVDGTALALGERGGVEVDYCPECRGIWPDRADPVQSGLFGAGED